MLEAFKFGLILVMSVGVVMFVCSVFTWYITVTDAYKKRRKMRLARRIRHFNRQIDGNSEPEDGINFAWKVNTAETISSLDEEFNLAIADTVSEPTATLSLSSRF
jgi:hypothetical protein